MSNKIVIPVVSLFSLFASELPLQGQTTEDRLSAVENRISNPNIGLIPRLGTVESKIDGARTGLSPRIANIETKLGKVETTINDPGDSQREADKKQSLSPRLEHLEKLISDPNTGLQITSQTLKRLWVLLAAVLVFFMQAGFMCLEVGLGRRRHEGAIGMMNLMNWLVLCVIFYCWGFGFMFGTESLGGFLGVNLFFPSAEQVEVAYKPLGLGMEFLLFQLAFAATTATIVDGAIAERAALFPYFLATVLTGTLVYPVFGHWAWNDLGWLKHIGPALAYHDTYGDHRGFHDFAGSTVVHTVGAAIAMVAVKFVGPRRYFSAHQTVFQPYSIGYAVLGVIMLWFGWWGFNGGSLLKYDSTIASIILHTNLAGASAGIAAYLHALLTGKGNVYAKTIGGTLGGLVAITACCDVADPRSALLVGVTAGVVHNWAFERLPGWGIDDVAGAIPVHGACGVWGTLCTGVIIWRVRHGSLWQILVQVAGILAAIALAGAVSSAIFWLLERTIGLRVSIAEEDGGQRSPFKGQFDGSLQISRHYSWRIWFFKWINVPLFWSKFRSFEGYVSKLRTSHPAMPEVQSVVKEEVEIQGCQVIRIDDTPADAKDIDQAVEQCFKKAS